MLLLPLEHPPDRGPQASVQIFRQGARIESWRVRVDAQEREQLLADLDSVASGV
jgi:hypothetical protein